MLQNEDFTKLKLEVQKIVDNPESFWEISDLATIRSFLVNVYQRVGKSRYEPIKMVELISVLDSIIIESCGVNDANEDLTDEELKKYLCLVCGKRYFNQGFLNNHLRKQQLKKKYGIFSDRDMRSELNRLNGLEMKI